MPKRDAQLLLNSDKDETIIHVNTGEDHDYLTDEEIALDAFMEESKQAGSEAVIIVKKVMDTGNPNSSLQHCDTFPVDKYDFHTLHSVIKARWNDGDYRLLCFAKRNGKKVLVQNKLISIAREITPEKNSGNDSVIQQLLAEQRKLNEKLMAINAPVKTDMMAQVAEMATIMNLLRPPERDTMSEIVKMVMAFKEIAPMLGIGQAPDVDEGNGAMWNALGMAIPALIAGTTQAGSVNNTVHPHVNRAPDRSSNQAGQSATRKPNPINAEETKAMSDKKMIQSYLKHLEQYCNKVDAREVAEYIEDKAPDFDALMDVIKAPDFMTQNSLGFWSVINNREWLHDVREWLLGFIGEPSIYLKELQAEENAPDNPDEIAPEFVAGNNPYSVGDEHV